MTTISSTSAFPAAERATPQTTFLRRLLKVDAALSAASALPMLVASNWLGGLTGLPTALLFGAGLFLLAWVAALAWLATREQLPRPSLWAVALLNLGWTLDCAWVAFGGAFSPTGMGQAFLLLQAVVTLLLADLMLWALWRSR